MILRNRPPLFLAGGLFGLLILGVAYRFYRLGQTTQGLIALPAMVLLALAALADIKRKTIPDRLTLPALAWVLAASFYLGLPRTIDALLGVLVCGGAMLLLALVSRGGIGGGDVKLMAVVGAFLGLPWGFYALVCAQITAALVVICLLVTGRKQRKDALPFGPFLSAFAILLTLLKPL